MNSFECKQSQPFNPSVTGEDKSSHLLIETKENLYCDNCRFLAFLPDPDPTDDFRDDDKKAVCSRVSKVIEGGLEFNELKNIKRPSFCPKNQINLKENYIHNTINCLTRALNDVNFETACLRIYNRGNLLSLTMSQNGREVYRYSIDLTYLTSFNTNDISRFTEKFIKIVKEIYGENAITQDITDHTAEGCTVYHITK